MENVVLYVKLKEVLKNRGLTQLELSEMTSIRPASISEIANNQRLSIHKKHIEKIASALKIDNINELMELKKVTE